MLFRTGELIINSGFSGNKWTNGVVFYEFDVNVDPSLQSDWLDAAAEWSAIANLEVLLIVRINSQVPPL